MALTTILCPIDFSAATPALVAYAAALAASTGAELQLLYVQEPQPVLPSMVAEAARELARYHAAAEAAGARVRSLTRHGEAAAEIVAEARHSSADLVVIGTHGRTGLVRFLMGHTTEAVVRTASCATLLVKPPAAPAAYRRSA